MVRKFFRTLLFVILSATMVVWAHHAHAQTYSHGDACTVAGAWHQKNSASGNDYLICDGSTWKSAIFFDKSGDNIRLDDNPGAGTAGCIKYTSASGGKLQFSNDCSVYYNFGDTVNPGNRIVDADNNTKVQVEEGVNDNTIRFDTNGTERMLILPGGYIGIGTQHPATPLKSTAA